MDAPELIQGRLRQRLLEAKVKNPKVSVRSFARQMKIPAGTISLVLLGKRKISSKLALKFADALFFDPMERARIEKFYTRAPRVSKSGGSSILAEKLKPENLRLSADQFHVMKDWYYFAILNLIQTEDYQHNPEWIAGRLNLKPEIVKEAIERLERLNLILQDSDGRIQRQHRHLRTSDDVQSLSARYAHHQNLDMAKVALEERAIDERDFTWLTLPVDFSQMKEMKLMIREFEDQFLQKFGKTKGANEVARMCVQLFPLTQPRPQGKVHSLRTGKTNKPLTQGKK